MVPDFPLLLSQLVSSNPHDAYSYIETLRKQNLGLFLVEMAKQLFADNIPANQRQMAALVIKNSVIGPSKTITQELSTQWLAIPQAQRETIKHLLIQGLSIAHAEARATASQVVGQIGAVELCHGQWTGLISLLLNNMTKGESEVLKEGTLNALGVLCEEIPNGILENQSADILFAIVSGTGASLPVQVHRAAIKALLGALRFVASHFEHDEHRSYIMNVMIASAKETDQEVRYLAVQCLVKTAELYYNYIAEYIEIIWHVTVVIIQSDSNENTAQQALEFWSTICDTELSIFSFIEEGGENIILHKITHSVAGSLAPVLFECFTKQALDLGDDEWNIGKSASVCLSLMAQTICDSIVPIATPFIQSCLTHENWRYRDAATMILGCILDGPAAKSGIAAFLTEALPILVRHLKDDTSLHVRDTTAWGIGQISTFFPDVIEANYSHVISALLHSMAHDELSLVQQSCSALFHVISIYNYEGEETSPLSAGFSELFLALIAASSKPGASDSNICVTAFETVNVLIAQAALDSIDFIIGTIDPFIKRIEGTFNPTVDNDVQTQLQSYIPNILQTITEKVGEDIVPFAEKIIAICFKIFEYRKVVVDEPIMAINSILVQCDHLSVKVFPPMKPYLCAAFKNPEDLNCLIASLQCLSLLSECSSIRLFEHDNGMFCDNIVQSFFEILQNPSAPFIVKPEIFSMLADMSIALGGAFERYFPTFISSLESASLITIPEDADDTVADNIIQLRKTILQTYNILVHSAIFRGAINSRSSCLLNFFTLLWQDTDYRTKGVIKLIVSLIGDISLKFKELPSFKNVAIITEIVRFGRNRSTNAKVRNMAASIVL